jgi:mycofactocin precursor
MAEHEAATHEAVTFAAGPEEALTSDELLVEEVSIDGMCGVY